MTGAGERAFCAGMDMASTIPAAQRLARGERIAPAEFEGLRNVATALLAGFDLGKPLVAAVNGHARAGGLDLLLAAEIRYAVPHATFALEEVALGLYPTGNATVLLPRQIGWVHAHELLLTARPIDAERARAIGLVNELVEPRRAAASAPSPRPTRSRRTPRSPCKPPARACASCSRSRWRRPIAGRRSSAARCAGRRTRARPSARSSSGGSPASRAAEAPVGFSRRPARPKRPGCAGVASP